MVTESLIGKSIGKYKIVEPLGRGGMAEVYRAYQESLDRYVAIKLMHSFLADEKNFLTRFQREAKAMASLNHPNIVGVYDFDVQEGVYYIVMEFVSGGTLKQRLEQLASRNDHLPLSQSIRIVLEIADALSYAHSRGMVHRDIKPGNIMISDEGRAILTDFGIAKILSGPSFTATGAMVGTPAYMSPEQGLGQAGDERSDLYALGVLFYQMTTGRLPYDADTPLAVILKHVNEPIPAPSGFNPELPPEIQAVIVKSMAKDPEQRYQSAFEMATDLQKAANEIDLSLTSGLTLDYIKDRPTPPPRGSEMTDAGRAAATMLAPKGTVVAQADATRLATPGMIERTEIASPIAPERPKRRIPVLVIGLIALVVVVGGAVAVVMALGGGGGGEPTPTDALVLAPSDTPEPGETPPTPEPTLDVLAAFAQTLTAQPTNTAPPSLTPTQTNTPTPDATGTFLATCEYEVTLLDSYTRNDPGQNLAVIGTEFEMTWVLENSGTCPIAADFEWTYVSGEEFGQSGGIIVDEVLDSGDQVTVSTLLVAPAQPQEYESTWQLMDNDGEPVGPEITYAVTVYRPVTATPRPTVGPTNTPTVATTGSLRFDWFVGNCEYVGADWTCILTITPHGGVPPYVILIEDASPPTVFNGNGPFSHPILSRRCNAWVHNVIATDQAGATSKQGLFIDPDVYIPGGCIIPD